MAVLPIAKLLLAAAEALKFAYAPYSGDAFGAALLGADGVIYTGVTAENASFSASLCAEHAAVAKALSKGCRKFSALAIAAKKGGLAIPCGRCRQVLAEFSPDLTVILRSEKGEILTYKLTEMLPNTFNLRVN
ncbi:MAG: cytidine deaminase [Ruminococcus sp.]|jgi:cytidine deaminase|nr:cytidine deaminase [Ruminococcus sp.]